MGGTNQTLKNAKKNFVPIRFNLSKSKGHV